MHTIAYLGSPGSYTHVAAEKYFATDHCRFVSCRDVSDVFGLVSGKDGKGTRADFGVIPLENSLHGTVAESFDFLQTSRLSLVGELFVSIHHVLLGKHGTGHRGGDLRWVRRCFSHWQAISQCRTFFSLHPWIVRVVSSDTATAARDVSRSPSDGDVAIGGKHLASVCHLDILPYPLDEGGNVTRWGVISPTPNTSGNKLSVSFSVKHVPGSLVYALTPYATFGLNLLSIESRPKKDIPWEYTFFLDLDIDGKEREAEHALSAMRKATSDLTVLGRYQKGVLHDS